LKTDLKGQGGFCLLALFNKLNSFHFRKVLPLPFINASFFIHKSGEAFRVGTITATIRHRCIG
jgi:hypothetical protein